MLYISDQQVGTIINTLRKYNGKEVVLNTQNGFPLYILTQDDKRIYMYNYDEETVSKLELSGNVTRFTTKEFMFYYTPDRTVTWRTH